MMINNLKCQNNTILDNINQYFYAGLGEGHGFKSPPPGPGVLIQYRNLYNGVFLQRSLKTVSICTP